MFLFLNCLGIFRLYREHRKDRLKTALLTAADSRFQRCLTVHLALEMAMRCITSHRVSPEQGLRELDLSTPYRR